jgi:capsular exopolysaccharide synthesis family protein
MTAVAFIRAVFRRWWIPAFVTVIAVAAVFALTPKAKAAQVHYTAKTILVINPSLSGPQSVNLSEAALETTVGSVPAAAASALHYQGNPTALAAQVTSTVDTTVNTLNIQSSGTNGPQTAAIVNEFATALNNTLLQQETSAYQAQVATIEGRLNSLQAQIDQYQTSSSPVGQAKLGAAEDQYRLAYDQFQQLAAQGQPVAPFTVLQKAVPVVAGGSHPPRSRVERSVIGGAVGLVIGILLAVVIDMLWPRINNREDAEREFGTVVLAEVPKLSRRDRRASGRHREAGNGMASFREAYRMLRTSILLIGSVEADEDSGEGQDMLVAGPQVILVSSALPREGKSTTVASLAASMAETGRTVLVCNADFRAPQVHRSFDLEPGPGLSDLLSGRPGLNHLADLVHPTGIPGVSFVHSGSEVADAAELIARRGAELLEEARSIADVVLLDTAPLLVVSDASELLPAVDAVVMVARAGQTSKDSARRSYELLFRAGIPVLGVVLVGAKSPMSYYYGGRYGTSHGSWWKIWLHRRGLNRGVVSVGSSTSRRGATPWPSDGGTVSATPTEAIPKTRVANGKNRAGVQAASHGRPDVVEHDQVSAAPDRPHTGS